ncbi:MAG: hypothetical protein ACLUHJ_08305 [Ruminococcus sp.]
MAANKDQEKLDQLYALYEQPMYRIATQSCITQNRRKMLYPMRFSES